MIRGKGVSKGVALAKQRLLNLELTAEKELVEDLDGELERLAQARRSAVQKLHQTIERMKQQFGSDEQEVFEAQELLLDSDELWNTAAGRVKENGYCAQWAFHEAIEEQIQMFSQLDSDYLRERILDLKDIRQNVFRCLRHQAEGAGGEEDMILIAREIMPSQLADSENGHICGLAMEEGGSTSHTVLLANMMGIPCVVGAAGLLEQAREGENMLLDGDSGEIYPDPDEQMREDYRIRRARLEAEAALNQTYYGLPNRSRDGREMDIWCNIAAVQDADTVVSNDGGGVGLMRSEFLFLGRQSAPDEEEQYTAYRQTALALKGRPLVIRTLDIGGDKQVPYLDFGKEENPFLGFRAIRYCLQHDEIFIPQLRAILRAGAGLDVRMMFPMVATMSELTRAKAALERAREELRREGIPFREGMPVGMMVEVPSAAVMAETFAQEVDFFSIGTNDLTQYVFSADRGNPRVADLNRAYDPALLKLVCEVAQKGAQAGIPVAICGHAGQDAALLPLWFAMGIQELSVSPGNVLELRRRLAGLEFSSCSALLEQVLSMPTAEEVLQRLEKFQADQSAVSNS